ncbi:tautomerase family protein [Catellatospora sp. NPDC049133]|jgi:phenylpyruvate tautomerase PptA (4-oxalocrotonate tautomerase family)|uniref:tautomerase family protein n=1 Tax=Catellatospora sp. NPDC049133 TaxID=3155499 RepID=UPI0033C7586B
MPLIHVYSPVGTFSDAARDALAEELTTTIRELERLPMAPYNKSTTWIYFHDVPPGHVYHGGKPGGTNVIALEINYFEGGLDEAAKRSLYQRYTQSIGKHAGIPEEARVPAYILLREMDPVNWGVFGATTKIEELRIARPDKDPI